MWPEPLKLSCIAAVALLGIWLVGLSLAPDAAPSLVIDPPPHSARFSAVTVTPLPTPGSRGTNLVPPGDSPCCGVPTNPPFVSIGTPERVFVNDPCVSWRDPLPGVFRHPRCRVLPTPAMYGMGR